MKVINLSCEPYHFSTILSCDIHKTVNQHFELSVSGYTTDSTEDIMKIADKSEQIIIYAEEEVERKSIFRGKICNIKIRTEGGLKILTICAQSNTCRLDESRHIRTFQNLNNTYRDIVKAIINKTEKTSVIYYAGESEQIEGLMVQYKETDWEFLKRLAAGLNTVLVPDCTNDSICFYFGIPEKKVKMSVESEDIEMSVHCVRSEAGKNIIEYQVQSREIWDLCTPVVIMGTEMLVCDIRGVLAGGEILWYYKLRRHKDFRPVERYNKEIIGASLFGRVTDIKKDLVKLKLDCEDDYSGGIGIWFQFATVYTSSDGNGWYFMPDRGERVRLCFPDEKESNAYVASATYLEDAPGKKNNPDIKFIRTSQGKEIRLAPDYILITNHKGMSIRLDDEKGIEIKSSENIRLNSSDGMTLSGGGNLKIESGAGIMMSQNNNSIIIREGICVNGVRVRFQQ